MSSFGKNLRQIREQCGISQQELAEMVGTTQPRISEWERDRVEPSLYNILKLIEILHVSFDELTDDIQLREH